jgi:hypothetical protein
MIRATLIAATVALTAPSGQAAEPEILEVTAEKAGMVWRVSVTLKHPDTGWGHYADGWEVLDTRGTRLGLRTLHHPHVTEQPFTRSLTGLSLPDGTRAILVRARCSKDGWAGETVRVPLSP